MVGARAVDGDLAAGDPDRREERGGLDAIGDDRVVDGAQRLDALDRDRRRPGAEHPRAHAIEEGGEIGDLGLAGGVVDDRRPLREHGRHQRVLGGADTRVLEQDASTDQHVGARLDEAVREVERRAELLRALQVHVDRTRPEVVAARHRDTRARPTRASSGPSTTIDARMRSTSS